MPDPEPGSQTFFYTNQQSARLMFYHDHSFGITRLNVYAGEAAGYVLRDAVEQKLIANGTIPANRAEIPLVIQDRTFVPGRAARLAGPDLGQDPVGRLRQPVVPPRVHAGPEPRRPERHERVRALDVRAVVLAACGRH